MRSSFEDPRLGRLHRDKRIEGLRIEDWIRNAELYRRLKARGVVVVSGHYFFPGIEADDWPHKRECIRISYADDWERVERGLAILVEEVHRARDDG